MPLKTFSCPLTDSHTEQMSNHRFQERHAISRISAALSAPAARWEVHVLCPDNPPPSLPAHLVLLLMTPLAGVRLAFTVIMFQYQEGSVTQLEHRFCWQRSAQVLHQIEMQDCYENISPSWLFRLLCLTFCMNPNLFFYFLITGLIKTTWYLIVIAETGFHTIWKKDDKIQWERLNCHRHVMCLSLMTFSLAEKEVFWPYHGRKPEGVDSVVEEGFEIHHWWSYVSKLWFWFYEHVF